MLSGSESSNNNVKIYSNEVLIMDKMPILAILLQSIPECFIWCWLALKLLKIQPNLGRLLLVAVIFGFCSYFIREFVPVFGLHVLIQILVIIVLLVMLIRLSLYQATAATLLGKLISIMLEIIFIPILLHLTGLTFNEVLADNLLRIIFPVPHLIFALILIWIIKRQKFYLIDLSTTKDSFSSKSLALIKKSTKLYCLGFITIVGLIILVIMNTSLAMFYQQAFAIIPLVSIIIINTVMLCVIIFTNILFFKQLTAYHERESQYQARQDYVDSVEEMFTALKTQRHDMLNHVQVLYGLLMTDKHTKTKEYIQVIFKETVTLNEIIDTDCPELSALLQAKSAIAANAGINFEISIQNKISELAVKPHELVAILGNVIDNAFDAVKNTTGATKTVSFFAGQTKTGYLFEIKNIGKITPAVAGRIFKKGVSSKKGAHMGMGLHIVKKIVEKNGGTITIESENELQQVICTIELPKVNYRKKLLRLVN